MHKTHIDNHKTQGMNSLFHHTSKFAYEQNLLTRNSTTKTKPTKITQASAERIHNEKKDEAPHIINLKHTIVSPINILADDVLDYLAVHKLCDGHVRKCRSLIFKCKWITLGPFVPRVSQRPHTLLVTHTHTHKQTNKQTNSQGLSIVRDK